MAVNDSLSMWEILQISDTLEIGDTLVMAETIDTIPIFGSAVFSDLKRITEREKLDLSYNPSITSLEPLSRLTELRELDISGTVVNSLVPLRNLTRLEVLNCSNFSYKKPCSPEIRNPSAGIDL